MMDYERRCCVACFASRRLREIITDHGVIGTCDYCRSAAVHVANVALLKSKFTRFLLLYEPLNDTGLSGGTDPLIYRVQQFGVFSGRLTHRRAAALLEDILNVGYDDDDGEPPIDAWEEYQRVGEPWDGGVGEEWSDFCSEVMEDPAAPFPFSGYVAHALRPSGAYITQAVTLWRGRPHQYGEQPTAPYTGADIGAPPSTAAKDQRVSVAGESVLYCADSIATVVAECRCTNGFISIAPVAVRRRVRVSDLARELRPFDPFSVKNLQYTLALQEQFYELGAQMGTPRNDDDDTIEYRPCQCAAREIRRLRYDGIRYPSAARGGGVNTVIFNPSLASIGDSALYIVEDGVVRPA